MASCHSHSVLRDAATSVPARRQPVRRRVYSRAASGPRQALAEMPSTMTVPRCSVCIPTWNGAADLERLLPALAAQELDGGFEIVAVDSGSTDASRELLETAGARVRSIA